MLDTDIKIIQTLGNIIQSSRESSPFSNRQMELRLLTLKTQCSVAGLPHFCYIELWDFQSRNWCRHQSPYFWSFLNSNLCFIIYQTAQNSALLLRGSLCNSLLCTVSDVNLRLRGKLAYVRLCCHPFVLTGNLALTSLMRKTAKIFTGLSFPQALFRQILYSQSTTPLSQSANESRGVWCVWGWWKKAAAGHRLTFHGFSLSKNFFLSSLFSCSQWEHRLPKLFCPTQKQKSELAFIFIFLKKKINSCSHLVGHVLYYYHQLYGRTLRPRLPKGLAQSYVAGQLQS